MGAELNIAPRYLVAIENDGQHPSLQVLYDLVNLFELSVDQYFHPDKKPEKAPNADNWRRCWTNWTTRI